MAVFKCKMCGGDLEILDNATVCECEYCGTKQTLPKLNDEKRVQLYDRANYFRRENEFDKAMGIYEMILSEANDDAESYWGIVLCRYGIEYVEDPRTHRRIPTVNRAQFTSIFDDEDYKKALEYADVLQKEVYEAEAGVIDKIQKGILDISNKEEPFDVFICYKELDENGQRTKDSVYAQSIYDWLVKQGYKVFFSRITLEDKLGSAYEPYIFAALNSARVMLVVGTKKEYFNAVWVKNEWSRYLSLIKAGKEKTIIPVYKDISPYDLPEEFQYLQAQDMNKIGFSQDLGRGIRKLIPISEPEVVKETVVVNQSQNSNVAPLLERAFMFLEDGDFKSANEYCEKVLDIDPKNASAYLGKLLSELRVRKQESLKDQAEPFDNNNNYQKAIRFADEKLKSELMGYIEHINARNEKTRVEGIYTKAKNTMTSANTENAYKEAAELFESIIDYSDSKSLCEECKEKAEIARKDAIIDAGKAKMKVDTLFDYEAAIKLFESIPGWNDADEQMSICKTRIEELKLAEEEARIEEKRKAEEERIAKEKAKEKRKKLAIGIPSGVVAIALAVVLLVTVIIPKIKFSDIVAISAGFSSTVGLKSDGTVVVAKRLPVLNDHLYWSDIVDISEGGHTVGLKSDGTVVVGGSRNYDGECNVQDWRNIVAISAGEDHTVGLKSDGTVVAVGEDFWGQCDVLDWSDIVAISAGSYYTVGLKSDGTVVVTKFIEHENQSIGVGQLDVEGWKDIVAVSAGDTHIVGLKSDGTVVATKPTGDEKYNYGQYDVEGWTDIVAISAGSYYTVGLKSDGTVVAVGANGCGQCDVLDWTDIVAISTGDIYTVGLKSDGTVVATGENCFFVVV